MQRRRFSTQDIQSISFVDETNTLFNATDPNRENTEQYIADKFVKPDDCILELGARYGTVSCIANAKLTIPFDHVAVEPDKRAIEALNINRGNHASHFFIFDGIISSSKRYSLTKLDDCRGYGTTSVEDEKSTIPIKSLSEIQRLVSKPFTCLIADCEGFLETFFDENPEIIKTLRMVTFEKDGECDYEKIIRMLIDNGFELVFSWNSSHFVYEKKINV